MSRRNDFVKKHPPLEIGLSIKPFDGGLNIYNDQPTTPVVHVLERSGTVRNFRAFRVRGKVRHTQGVILGTDSCPAMRNSKQVQTWCGWAPQLGATWCNGRYSARIYCDHIQLLT